MKNHKEKNLRDIREVAARKLARSSKTAYELTVQLKKLGYEEEDVKSTIDSFLEIGYLDDYKYSLSFFRLGANKGWGEGRIKRELGKKGVSQDIIMKALQNIYNDRDDIKREDLRALEVARKMVSREDLNSKGFFEDKIKSRIARRLYSYGYSSDLIFKTIRTLERELMDNGEDN